MSFRRWRRISVAGWYAAIRYRNGFTIARARPFGWQFPHPFALPPAASRAAATGAKSSMAGDSGASAGMAETISRAEETKRKASRSSFYLAMRLMPRAEREAMFAIYAFSRAVDDIADDGNGTRAARRTELDHWRGAIGAIYDGAPSPRADFLAAAVR